jgi:uncharacterized caspase-like protein
MLDADATASKLDRLFVDLGTKVGPNDVFVFYMAGHGKTQDGHYHFIPSDFQYDSEQSITTNAIDENQIQSWMARISATKSLMISDTCESGSLTDTEFPGSVELMSKTVGRTILAASTADTNALEGVQHHGVYTYVLLDAIGEAAAGSDGSISVDQLVTYVDQQVPIVSLAVFKTQQIPERKLVGSDFPLLSKTSVIPASADDIPAQPTHVIIAPTVVRQSASATGQVVTNLGVGVQVRLIQSGNGWSLIARGGKKLGYVDQKALAVLQ